MIKFRSVKKLPPKQLYELYKSVNWVEDNVNPQEYGILLSKVYASSSAVFSAWDKTKMVGAIRVVTDKLAHGIIFGLAIEPQYQDQGIATELLARCFKKYPRVQWHAEVDTPAAELF